MDLICCVCKASKKCYPKSHWKIKKIQKMFIQLYHNLPSAHVEMNYCETCCVLVYDELLLEIEAQKLHRLKTQIPHQIQTSSDSASYRCQLLNENETDYKMVAQMFHQTVDNEIVRIEKICNKVLLQNFKNQMDKLNDHSIKYLFHGSNNQNYNKILSEGFKLDKAKSSGLLGAGIYFAKNASYSHNYTRAISTIERGTIKNMICARVIFGRIGENTKSGNDIWAVFSEEQCYPEYVVYYQC